MIYGVEFKELVTYPDSRGFFREIIRSTDSIFKDKFGQLSHSLVYAGVIKGWHGHNKYSQWNYVLTGLINVWLYDNRLCSPTYKESMEFLCGENHNPVLYYFPPGVLHAYKCINGPMNIIYVTSGVYDICEEIRIEYDSKEIPVRIS